MLYGVEGIVIRSVDYGESNKIITLCTKSHGKIGVFVRSAKKIRSRHAAATQLFTYGEFVFSRGMGHLGTLHSCEIMGANQLVREQLHLVAYASYVAELVDKALHDEEAGGMMFEQLHAYLCAIVQGKDVQVTTHLFEMKLWQRIGVTPQLHRCVTCGGKENLHAFSWWLGGALCNGCKSCEHADSIANLPMLLLLQSLEKIDLHRLGNITLKLATKLQLRACMRGYMDKHVNVRLKSLQFLEKMEKYDLGVCPTD